MNGSELGEILRREYGIYPELEEEFFVLLMVTVGDTPASIARLVEALVDIGSRKKHLGETAALDVNINPTNRSKLIHNLIPEVVLSPRQAFHALKRKCELKKAAGRISGSLVVPYPPGVPLLCPGERISLEIVEYLYLAAGNNAHIQGLSRSGRELELLVLEC
jgi:arginine/lysine/ornithine decarboxylase